MQHGRLGRRFGRKSEHRQAMFSNLAASLIRHEQIVTTLAKAKDLKRVIDKYVTLAKRYRQYVMDTGLFVSLKEKIAKKPLLGEIVLFVAGFVQSFCMIPMAVLLLRVANPAFRGRVMGVRMLAVYGMAIGLLAAGPLVEHTGFAVTGTIFSLVGIVFTVAVGLYWRRHLWDVGADANAR